MSECEAEGDLVLIQPPSGTSEVRFWLRAGRNKQPDLEEFERLKETIQEEIEPFKHIKTDSVDGKSDLGDGNSIYFETKELS